MPRSNVSRTWLTAKLSRLFQSFLPCTMQPTEVASDSVKAVEAPILACTLNQRSRLVSHQWLASFPSLRGRRFGNRLYNAEFFIGLQSRFSVWQVHIELASTKFFRSRRRGASQKISDSNLLLLSTMQNFDVINKK